MMASSSDAFVIAVRPNRVTGQEGGPYWAAYVYAGNGAQPIAEAIMHGLAQALPDGGGTVALVRANASSIVVASEPWAAETYPALDPRLPTLRLGTVGDWLSSFAQRWAANWWRR
jgi:hypothetical protein